MDAEQLRRLVIELASPVLASFKKEVAAMRARGCSEAEVEKYIGQIESNFMIMAATKTDALTPELIQDFMELFREAARKPDEGGKTD
jgi:hypothetical protein